MRETDLYFHIEKLAIGRACLFPFLGDLLAILLLSPHFLMSLLYFPSSCRSAAFWIIRWDLSLH